MEDFIRMKIQERVKREPVVAGDVVKVAVWLLMVLVTLGVVTNEEAAQVRELVVVLAPGAAVVVQMLIAYAQRQGVTPWQADNPLVIYEPGAAMAKDEAAE